MHRSWPLLCVFSPLLACPGSSADDDDVVSPPGDDDDDACEQDTDCDFELGLEVCEANACVDGDRNNSPEEAQRLRWDEPVSLVIAPAGDVDWFRIDPERGDMLRFDAEHGSGRLDPVLVFYDAEGREIAFNDDFERVASVPPDSRLFVGAAEAGAHYVSIQDVRSWIGDPADPPEGGFDFGYSLSVSRAGEGAGGNIGLGTEPDGSADEAGNWQLPQTSTNYTWTGVLQEPGDVDWVGVDLEQGETLRLYGYPNGGSAAALEVSVYLPGGQDLVATWQGLNWSQSAWIPVLDDGTHFVVFRDAGGGGGWDHWYTLHAARDGVDEGLPAEAEPNDEGQPSGLDLDGGVGAVELWARIHPPGDVDTYTLAAQAGDRLSLRFERTPHGESTALSVELIDPAGDPAASASWNGEADPVLTLQELTSAGPHRVVVREQDPAAGGAGHYYRMRLSQQR